MGLYINPATSSKEQWLKRYARQVDSASFVYAEKTGQVPIILIDNGMFTACAVAYKESEFKEITRLSETRPRTFFYADTEELKNVLHGEEYNNYEINKFEK